MGDPVTLGVSAQAPAERWFPRYLTKTASGGVGTAAAGALLVVLTLAVYLPALHAGFIWDDDDYVTANVTLRNVEGLRRIWLEPGAVPQYYPITFTSLWVNYQLGGPQPLGYHLVNILLHAVNALLLWRVLRRLRVPGSWVAAAVFAVHPMMVESVAWITERKNVLSGLFYLAALLAYLRSTAPAEDMSDSRIQWRFYLAACALFVGALLSKSVTCSLPAVMLLLAWWKGRLDRHTVGMLAPLFVLGIVMAALTVWMERYHVRAEGAEWALSFVERGLVAGRALWFYPRSLLWPRSLTFIYPRWTIDAHTWWQPLFPAAAGAVFLGLYLARGRIGKGPLVATLCYTGTLVPALGFFNVYPMRYSFVADHFAYLAAAALIALAAAAGAELVRRAGRAGPAIAYATVTPVLLVLAMLTGRQCRIYQDLRTLWTDTLAKNPDCWLAHNNLGVMLLGDGDIDAAAMHFTQALRAQPGYREALINLGNTVRAQGKVEESIPLYAEAVRRYPESTSAHAALAIVLLEDGKPEEALAHLQHALQLDPTNAEAHATLGQLLQNRGALADAVTEYREALRLKPDSPVAHYNLAGVLAAQGQMGDAIRHYGEVVRLKPGFAAAHYNLGTLLLGQGRLDDAKAHFAAALQLKPDYAEAHSNLGYLLFEQGQTADAIAEYQQALRIKPDYPEAQTNLAMALAAEGKTAAAIVHYEAALQVKPDHAAAHRNLGIALARQGNTARAITELQEALRLSPDDGEARQQLEQLRERQQTFRQQTTD
jgi:tetratricopeptide (TPR) repeat protein